MNFNNFSRNEMLTTPCFSGLYVGAGVGPEGASFSQKSHVVGFNFNVVDKEHFSGTGVFGTLFAGYGVIYNQYYLAVEGNANLSSVQYKLSNDEYVHRNFVKTTFTIKNSEGVSLLPGLFLSEDTLLYGRVGYINGRLKIRESDPTIRSMTKNRNGIRYGVGIRHNLTNEWTLMMDYSQINYASVKSTVFEPFGGVLKQTRITANTAQVGFGIIYNFDVPKKAYVK
jgi:outer membrane immunogenic protein